MELPEIKNGQGWLVDEIHASPVLQRLAVIRVARRYHEVERPSLFIADEARLETEESLH